MSWTQPSDVTGAWIGDDTPTDDAKLQVWIDKAEREIKSRVPDIQTRIDAEAAEDPPRTDLLETTKDVVVSMVTRKFENPKGVRQTSTTTGPFTESQTLGGETPGGLGLTDDELAKLSATRPEGAFTVSMIPPSSPFYVAPS